MRLTPQTDTPRRKATLFCPDCGHESPVGGDWLVHKSPGQDSFECPDCGTVLTAGTTSPLALAD